ncbi:hypothetical protein GCM10010329_58440 [Streptomyces spiroverticillatus]|uniref:Molecular chaperone n=1 Tax=Streptomyces finlayi TaxID=67296 RepID=A0A918X3P7_9ACTN|nr:hypothetical protein [Streptomyces finlayi]GHA27506.1 hypothetical protein GCM10010329_58440 [Streptomyces spiroverticillatus]GHD08618.1 hypothetical protein GCM10010334_62100 [Streptomyces finlayi]
MTMGLQADFTSSGPGCVPDGRGAGFTLTGPRTALEPPALRLAPTTGGVLVSRTEILTPVGVPSEVIDPLRAWYADAEGRVLHDPALVGGSGTVSLPGGLRFSELPLRIRIQYHEMNPVTGRPVGTIHHTVEAATTLHVNPAQEPRPAPDVPAATLSRRQEEAQQTVPSGISAAEPETVRSPTGKDFAERVPQDAVRHLGFAAVDFGTTNSTLTIHDMRQLEVRPMARRQEKRLRAELTDLLTDPAAAGPDGARWRQLLHDVTRQLLPESAAEAGGDPGRALAESLRSGHGGSNEVHKLCTALEVQLSRVGEPLQRRIAPRLHACYDRAFAELPLDSLRLFPAELDQVGGAEVASRIEVVSHTPDLRVRMGEERVAVGGTGGGTPRAYRGLKQYLGRDRPMPELPAHPDGSPVTADDLIREGLRYLLDQGDEYIAANPRELQQGKIDHVVMTYPTVAPPAVRRRLRELVAAEADGLGVTLVDTQFDEAVAAALFFIMKGLGGDFGAGVEAFRARCRELPGTFGKAWQQNALILDVGGGTSDVALISLHLKDRTPDPAPGEDERFTGRLYVLTPKLLGSTGHLQLGGDLMTLRLFRWYKAALADHLLRTRADDYDRVIGSLKEPFAADGRYAAGSLLDRNPESDGYPGDLVDMAVRTRWSGLHETERSEAEQAFWMLWRIAEEAKYQLGAGKAEYVPPPEEIAALLTRSGATGDPDAEWAPLMTAAVFEGLLAGTVDEIMDLVAAMARKLPQGQELDRVFLTGKSSRMPMIRAALEQRLNAEDDVHWNPAGIEVEEKEYAKLATSIGACWGHHVRRFAHNERTARSVLRRGRYVLRIEVDNLRYYLPSDFGATFQLGAAATPTDAMLKAGTGLSPIGPGGIWAVRSDWDQLPRSLVVHRGTGTSWALWGWFDPDVRIKRHEPGFVLDLEQWTAEAQFQVEVDADLFLHVHLCRGAPQYVVEGRSSPIAFDQALDEQGAWKPVQIVVDTRVAGDRPDFGAVVFDLPEDPREGLTLFDQTFRTGQEAGARELRGALSGWLDPPSPDGWSFYLRFPDDPDRPDELIDVVPIPSPMHAEAQAKGGELSHENAEYVATLDETGRLRVHRAPVPYWSAGSLAEMWQKKGSVFRVAMEDAQSAHFADRDPFNGRH